MFTMSMLEQAIRRYEHRRWTRDDNRLVRKFEWGLEHIGGRADEPDPRGFLQEWSRHTIENSDAWYATAPATDYRLEGDELTFTSEVVSPWPENNRVLARFFPAKTSGPAVVVMPHWNAKWQENVAICRWLNTLGISALRLSMPYHDKRKAAGHERADQLVAPNIGLTLQANQQAVKDVRRCLRWLEMRGYSKLGLLGSSIGSSVAFIAMAHDRAVRAGAFLHVSTYFGDVVRTGLTTMHVWEGLRAGVTADELHHYWSPISPYPYIGRVRGTGQRCLMISGKYDPTFWPEFSSDVMQRLRGDGILLETLVMPCGHYSLGLPPFSWAAGYKFGTFLFQSLT